MATLKIPQAETIFSNRPYSLKAVNALFSLIKSRSGSPCLMLSGDFSGGQLTLLILKGLPYAAGHLAGERFEPLSLHGFFKALSEARRLKLGLSVINPVFFKCLLVLFQKAPSVTGTTDLVNVEGLLERLKTSKQESVVTLRRGDDLNLFYITKGSLNEAFFVNPSSVSKDGTPEERFLEYAYTAKPAMPVLVQSFEDTQAKAAEDYEPDWQEPPEGVVDYFLSPRPELVFLSGESSVTKKIIHKKAFTLGRGPESDLFIADVQASRDHAVIREENGRYLLEDRKSRNGTLVNKKKITQVLLSDGDEIQIGNTRLLFREKPGGHAPVERALLSEMETTMLKMDEAALVRATEAQSTLPKLGLKLLSGPEKGTIVLLDKKVTIGRVKNDINLNDPKASRQHAAIEQKEDGYHFTDLNSTNGSFINDQRVAAKILDPGDVIKIGDTLMKVIEGDSLP